MEERNEAAERRDILETRKKELKLYHGLILMVLFAVILFVVAPIIGIRMGIYGALVGELLFLLLALSFTGVTRADFKRVFPLRKPRISAICGSLILWGAVFGVTMVITAILLYLFPVQISGANQNLENAYTNMPFWLAVIIIAIAPAICEEAVFRGVFMRSLSPIGKKWVVIVIVGVVFGAFHGSLIKFLPTAMLGILFGYIVWETNNMVYSVGLHFLNNFFSIAALYALQAMTKATGLNNAANLAAADLKIPLFSVGIYMMMATAVPFCFYIGNFLIHKCIPGAPKTLFPKEKRTTLYILIGMTMFIFLLAILLCAISIIVDKDIFSKMIQEGGYSLGWILNK